MLYFSRYTLCNVSNICSKFCHRRNLGTSIWFSPDFAGGPKTDLDQLKIVFYGLLDTATIRRDRKFVLNIRTNR